MTFKADHSRTLAAWALRHGPHGIVSAEMDEPAPGDDADLPPSAAIYLAERPDEAAYLVVQDGPRWAVVCHARGSVVGTAPDLLGALWLVRGDHQDTRAAA